ncbi:hypothetical protein VTI28DRAFT_7924 [Corynascus sepedonium]
MGKWTKAKPAKHPQDPMGLTCPDRHRSGNPREKRTLPRQGQPPRLPVPEGRPLPSLFRLRTPVADKSHPGSRPCRLVVLTFQADPTCLTGQIQQGPDSISLGKIGEICPRGKHATTETAGSRETNINGTSGTHKALGIAETTGPLKGPAPSALVTSRYLIGVDLIPGSENLDRGTLVVILAVMPAELLTEVGPSLLRDDTIIRRQLIGIAVQIVVLPQGRGGPLTARAGPTRGLEENLRS